FPLRYFTLEDDAPQPFQDPAFVIRMQDTLPEVLGTDGVDDIIPEQLLVRIAHQKHLIGNKVPVPYGVIRRLYDSVETLVALSEILHRALALHAVLNGFCQQT